MNKSTYWWGIALFLPTALLMTCTSRHSAQDTPAVKKHDATALYNSLREVINKGAKIFNEDGDHAGCYRLYQGSLLSVRPFLVPELQKSIDAGLERADNLQNFAEQAFELRKVLDEIRTQLKPGSALNPIKKTEEKSEEKKSEEKKTTEVKGEEKKPAVGNGEKGQIAGRIMYEGKPIAGGYFVTLVSTEDKKFSSAIQQDGSFAFATPIPPGDYRISIESIPGGAATIPARYNSEATSSLRVRVQTGKQHLHLSLVN